MTYAGAAQAAESRKLLGSALEALQRDPNVPKDVLAVAENIAGAVGALFEAEKAGSDLDGKASVKFAMGSLSQTMALLQDVKSNHEGLTIATQTLAQVMSRLYPLSQVPTLRPSAAPGNLGTARTVATSVVPGPAKPRGTPSVRPAAPKIASGPREKVEANVGATTETNFFVGFSGEISEGGVFIATYATLSIGALAEVLVTLPGNYQFTVPGVVRFVRDPMDMDSEPGIGIQFEALSPDHRELILRFIRKRPPVFYDE
ncbi:MAG TPA: PilZ domain-containing protein [Polyangiales bacterium]|nr:PilZ domain-containing protein [Polyangiales bacterium]